MNPTHQRRNKVIGSNVSYYTYGHTNSIEQGRVVAKLNDGYLIKPFDPRQYDKEIYRSFEEIV